MRARIALILLSGVLLFIAIGFSPEANSGTMPFVIKGDHYIVIVENHSLHIFFNNGTSLIESLPNVSVISGLFDGHSLYLVGAFNNHPSLIILDPAHLFSAKVYYTPEEIGALFSLSLIKEKVFCVGYIKRGNTYDSLEFILDEASGLSKVFIYSASLENASVPTYFRDVVVGKKEIVIIGDAYWRGNYFPSIITQYTATNTVRSWRMYVTAFSFPSLSNDFIVKGLLTNSTGDINFLVKMGDTLFLGELVNDSLLLKKIEGEYRGLLILNKETSLWLVLACLKNNSKVLITAENICPLNLESSYVFAEDNHLFYLSNSGKVLEAHLSKCFSLRFVGRELNLTHISLSYKFSETHVSRAEVELNILKSQRMNTFATTSPSVGSTIIGSVTISQGVNKSFSPLGNFARKIILLFIAGVILIMLSYFIKRKIS